MLGTHPYPLCNKHKYPIVLAFILNYSLFEMFEMVGLFVFACFSFSLSNILSDNPTFCFIVDSLIGSVMTGYLLMVHFFLLFAM